MRDVDQACDTRETWGVVGFGHEPGRATCFHEARELHEPSISAPSSVLEIHRFSVTTTHWPPLLTGSMTAPSTSTRAEMRVSPRVADRPASTFSRLVFPAPDGPRSAQTCPPDTEPDTPLRMGASPTANDTAFHTSVGPPPLEPPPRSAMSLPSLSRDAPILSPISTVCGWRSVYPVQHRSNGPWLGDFDHLRFHCGGCKALPLTERRNPAQIGSLPRALASGTTAYAKRAALHLSSTRATVYWQAK